MGVLRRLEYGERRRVVELSRLVFGDIVSNDQPSLQILPDIFAYWAIDLTGLVFRHVVEDDALCLNGDVEGRRVIVGIGIGESVRRVV